MCPDTLVILRLSGIVPRSPSHSCGSATSCPNPIFSGIVSGFPLIFPDIVPRFPLFSPASGLDLIFLLETRLVFSYLFLHSVQISLAFFGSVPGSFSPLVIMAHFLSLFMVVWGQNCWLFEFFTRVHFTHSLFALCIRNSLVHSLY